MIEQTIECPQCQAECVRIGSLWFCPEHGQVPEGKVGLGSKDGTVAKPLKRRIFLSYGHDDHAVLAKRLKADLEARGHEVWFDLDRLKPGGDWESYIEDGLRWAAQDQANGCLLLLMTPHSVRRPDGYCLNEIARAVEKSLFTVPVMVVQVEPPLSIARLQWFDMTACVPVDAAGPLYEDRRDVLVNALESGKVDFEGAQARLLNLLKPIQFGSDVMHHLRGFSGRGWVRDQILEWLGKPVSPANSRVFWITGAPGVGKTALSIWLATKSLPAIKAWHLCQYNHDINKDPKRCVASIACYLSRLLPDYFEKLTDVDLESTAEMTAGTLFKEILVEPLKAIPAPAEPVVILIDALDEAMQRSGHNEIAEFIGLEFDKTPEWLRLIVTSRPVPEVEQPLARYDPWRLDTGDPHNFDDIDAYARTELRPHAVSSDQLDAAVSFVKERSEGVFLYARYVCEEVTAGRLDITRPDAFPRGLAAVYLGFFRRQFQKAGEYCSLFAPVFEMMAAAREPLTVAMFAEHFGWSGRQRQRFIEGVGAIFRIRNQLGIIEPFHKSLMDWLTRDAPKDYYVDAHDGARALAEWGWRGYKEQGPVGMPPFFLRHLPTHLHETEQWDRLIGRDDDPGPLTDLRFIEAKCAAGLVHELVCDYNEALTELPEFREENERTRLHNEAIRHYNQELRNYAKLRLDWLECQKMGHDSPSPLYPSFPLLLQDACRSTIPEEKSPRAARLRHFSNFVSGHLAPLLYRPQDMLPLAWNLAEKGPVSIESEGLVAFRTTPWLRRYPRESVAPLRPQCLRTFVGHRRGVKSAIITPDGHRVVSASVDRTLCIWDLESGESLRILIGHSAVVNCVSICIDGRHAVSASSDHTLRIWDLTSGESLRILEGHSSRVNSVSVSPDGLRAVSASSDNTLRLWSLESGECLRKFEGGHTAAVECVCFSPDGRHAVSGGGQGDNTLQIWDLEREDCLHKFEEHTDAVTSVSITPDGRYAVSASRDKTLRIWNLERGECLRTLRGHLYGLTSVSVTPDGRRAATASWDGTVQIWDIGSGRFLRSLLGHTAGVEGVSLSPDGRRAVSASADRTLRLWDLESADPQPSSQGHNGRVKSVIISPDGRRAASASDDKTVRLWDLKTGLCQRTLDGHRSEVRSLSVSPDGGRLVSASWDKTLRVWNMESGETLRILKGHSDGVESVSLSPNGRRAVSASWDKTLRIWDLESGECLQTLQGHGGWICCVKLSPDGRRAISASSDYTLRIWDLESGKCTQVLEGHRGWVNCVCVTPDGLFAVSASWDTTLRLWDLRNGECLLVLKGHTDTVESVSITPDGRIAVSGSVDNTIRVWDLTAGNCLAVYPPGASVMSVATGSISNRIACGALDGQVQFLIPVNFPPCEPTILTAVRSTLEQWFFKREHNLARCPYCISNFPPSPEITTAIRAHTSTLRPGQSPCLDLPAAAFDDPRLLTTCPHCAMPLKFNPFFVETEP